MCAGMAGRSVRPRTEGRCWCCCPLWSARARAVRKRAAHQSRIHEDQRQHGPQRVPGSRAPSPATRGMAATRNPPPAGFEIELQPTLGSIPLLLADTILPVPFDWLVGVAGEAEAEGPPPSAEDTSERPRCWDMPRPERLLHEAYWPAASVDQMVQQFGARDWGLREHLLFIHAYDLDIPDWTPMACEPGSRVQLVTFGMPVPLQDLPTARKLIAIPDAMRIKTAYYYRRLRPRLAGQPAPVALVWQSHASGPPFSERYCIRGSIRFFPSHRGGLEVEAWAGVHMLQELPWGMEWAKSVVDVLAKKDATEHLKHLVGVLGQNARCIRE